MFHPFHPNAILLNMKCSIITLVGICAKWRAFNPQDMQRPQLIIPLSPHIICEKCLKTYYDETGNVSMMVMCVSSRYEIDVLFSMIWEKFPLHIKGCLPIDYMLEMTPYTNATIFNCLICSDMWHDISKTTRSADYFWICSKKFISSRI